MWLTVYMWIGFGAEVLKGLHDKGISWGALLTALILWNKLMRNKEFKERDERVERNQQRIMAHLGVEGEWSTQRKTLLETALMSLRRWYFSLQAVIAQVFQLRRGSKMQINKLWLSGVVTFILGQLALKYGFTWKDAWSDTITDWIITIILPLVVAWLYRTKKPKEVEPIVNTQRTNTFESNQ